MNAPAAPAAAAPAAALREVVRRYCRPIYMRISESDLSALCAEIAAGINTLGGAAALIGVDRGTIRRTMLTGAEAAIRAASGAVLCKQEQRALWFYDSVLCAQGGRERALTMRALGVGSAGGRESTNAMKILTLTCREYRHEAAPAAEAAEAEAAEAEAAEAAPTPEQTEAYLRREAARLGYRLLTAGETP
jgi:hypothetical protein